MKRIKSIINAIDNETQTKIVKDYTNKLTMNECGKKYNIPYHWIRKILLKNKVSLKSQSDYYKWIPTEEEKEKIINLYIKEKRGIDFIAKEMGIKWPTLNSYFKKWKIPKWSKKEIILSNIKIYGPTKGFSGHKHKKTSKEKISKGLYKNCNRTVTGSKSRFIETCIGKVQGTCEVAYLQKLLNEGLTLPKLGSKVITPIGLYFPDFEYEDRYVEVKSDFTWKVCLGELPSPKGIKSDKQYRKIKWTEINIKPVEVVVFNNQVSLNLFKQAIKNKDLVKEEIIYKNGKYYKTTEIYDNLL